MTVYYCIFFYVFILSFFAFNKNNNIKLLLPFILIYLIFFVGLRFDSVDYFEYEFLYDITSFDKIGFPFYQLNTETTGAEFIFASMSSFFHMLGAPFYVYTFFIAFLSLSIKFYILKKTSPYLFLSILIYLAAYFGKEFSQVRNALAASLVLYAAFYIVEKRPVAYVVTIFIASMIQIFAVVVLPVYWIYQLNDRYRHNYILYFILIGSLVLSQVGGIYFIVEPIVNMIGGEIYTKVYGYANAESRSILNVFGLGNLFFIMTALFAIYKSEDIKKVNPFAHAATIYITVGTSMYSLFADFGVLAFRSQEMFTLFPIAVVIPTLCSLYTKNIKYLLLFVIYLFCIYSFLINLSQISEYKVVF